MAWPWSALASATTTHCPGVPCPVRAKSNSSGAAPGVIFVISITVDPLCAKPDAPAHATTLAAMAAASHDVVAERLEFCCPSMRNLLDASSVAQSLDGG